MEWEPVGSSGRIISWKHTPDGATYTGTFVKLRKGRFGDLADLTNVRELDGENVTLDATIGLGPKLAELPEGTLVKITFLGKKLSEKSGHTYNAFTVQRPKATKTKAVAAPVETDADEVPF
jgi:hypothetical protein